MFYSESLLAKTGPLARVWLAANLERKLTKQNILQADIDSNVRDIMNQDKAPMALRLSSQLLCGVSRIFKRKSQYVLDDCSDLAGRMKQMYKPGNVNLPANQLFAANSNALTLPDAITEQDLFAPMLDPDDFFRNPGDSGLFDLERSQFMPETQSTPTSQRHHRPTEGLEIDDLGLNIDFDEPSIELGRGNKTALTDGPSGLQDDLGIDFGFNDNTNLDDDIPMLAPEDDTTVLPGAERNDATPIPDNTFRLNETTADEIDETEVQAAQRVKRRKVLHQDVQTELLNQQIKRQQQDTSAITRAPNYLPQDPFLMQLLEAQRSGAFVSSILGDGRMLGMAPELRSICSIEVIRKVGERKRKRDSGVADMDTSSERLHSSPRLDIPLGDEDFVNIDQDGFGETTFEHGTGIMDDNEIAHIAAQDVDGPSTMGQAFDHTEAPLLHPDQAGPVSLGTKTAVAALRNHVAPGHKGPEPPNAAQRTRSEAKFSDLCPKEDTTCAEATKMFFELLVLGTKDAVKIEQEKNKGLDGEIRVRGKRGLWGAWAEMSSQQPVTTV